MDPERLVADIYELMDYADEPQKREQRRAVAAAAPLRKTPAYYEGALAKGGDDEEDEDAYAAHAEVKTRHHEKMAALHAKISDLHASMSARYARAAHTEDGDERDDEDHEREDVGAVDEARIQLLQSAARDGDLATREQAALLGRAAVRECLSHPEFGDPATAERGGSR